MAYLGLFFSETLIISKIHLARLVLPVQHLFFVVLALFKYVDVLFCSVPSLCRTNPRTCETPINI